MYCCYSTKKNAHRNKIVWAVVATERRGRLVVGCLWAGACGRALSSDFSTQPLCTSIARGHLGWFAFARIHWGLATKASSTRAEHAASWADTYAKFRADAHKPPLRCARTVAGFGSVARQGARWETGGRRQQTPRRRTLSTLAGAVRNAEATAAGASLGGFWEATSSALAQDEALDPSFVEGQSAQIACQCWYLEDDYLDPILWSV